MNKYMREAQQASDPPPTLAVRYFYTSSLAIDDPLSPLPPLLSGGASTYRVPPRPFSVYDNATLDKEWLEIRRKRIKGGFTCIGARRGTTSSANSSAAQDVGKRGSRGSVTNTSMAEAKRRSLVGSIGGGSVPASPRHRPQIPPSPRSRPMARMPSNELISVIGKGKPAEQKGADGSHPSSLRLDPAESSVGIDTSTVTGNPFIRAPSRTEFGSSSRSRSTSLRPGAQKLDSYNWGEDQSLVSDPNLLEDTKRPDSVTTKPTGPSAKVPVGVSRLHEVVIPELQ
jgi:hypothetical protein